MDGRIALLASGRIMLLFPILRSEQETAYMALDLYWQLGQQNTWIGSLSIDTPLEELLFQFQRVAGIPVDPYGKSRVYLNQWERLTRLASEVGYPASKLTEVQARIPPHEPDGFIVLLGD